jgi:predicted dehydrogenase
LVTQDLHLPALSATSGVRLEGLVDPRVDTAEALAAEYGAGWACGDYSEAIARVDAVVLAAPNYLHAPLAVEFLREGVHVLVEKPMALTSMDCDLMIEAAEATGAVLAVGHMRRFYDWVQTAERLVRGRSFGPVRHVTVSEGERYRQQVRSDFRFQQWQSGGGVLVDRGVHVLDLLGWWLGECIHVDYEDDADGGVEAECSLRLGYEGGVTADVLLTRLRNVPSECRIDFDRASLLAADAGSPTATLRLSAAGVDWRAVADDTERSGSQDVWREAFERQFADFVAAIREGRDPMVPGREGRRAVGVVERCYAAQRLRRYPWETAS